MSRSYVPEAGDVVWLEFSPQMGREQAGRRPAVILSPRTYNEKVGLAVACPVTNQAKGYPFEVAMALGSRISGVVLADHLKSVDWRQRNAQKVGKVSRATLEQVLARIAALLGIR